MDPEVFPSPDEFLPERWMSSKENVKRMDSCFVPFAKGSRNCVGKK